ncbi:ribonucleotide reductase (RNR) inhibitor [Trifolium repens]|nr:ribonucleotide reductase (RNR) inhibitor [Trifolium repens]
MRAINSHVVLIDLHCTSWQQNNNKKQHYLNNTNNLVSSRRVVHAKAIQSAKSSSPSPQIRRPSDRYTIRNGSLPSISQTETTVELDMFLELLPLEMRLELYKHQEIGGLIEVVMDLGRKPLARFPSGDWVISQRPINHTDLQHAISKVGEFSDDNRSGIDSSLHRISAIQNRQKQIIGLTCRVGRAVSGSAEIIRDVVEKGGSILVIGPPGVGKTTLIRETARMLADEFKKRVVIVDTSNEIGGDGDVPHAGIGRARRMQVPNVNMQHSVMIEAVENHMPQTIIIDEIGTELEALAASTIAQRGVQLVGTAHGTTIESIMKNPYLQILVGGIESVTLGDEEARKRKVQKTILERKGPPTFTCAVEMISKTECRVHHRLDATVDAILAGRPPVFQVRHWDDFSNDLEKHAPLPEISHEEASDLNLANNNIMSSDREYDEDDTYYSPTRSVQWSNSGSVIKRSSPMQVYACKILEDDLVQVAKVMGFEDLIEVTDEIRNADAILASSSELRQNQWIRAVAKFHQLPIFVLKSNTMAKMVKAVRMILGLEPFGPTIKKPSNGSPDIEIGDDEPKRKPSLEEIDALEEVRLAIEYIVIPGGEAVELLPRRSEIIDRQLELVQSYQLAAQKSGTDQNTRLQILPLKLSTKKASKSSSVSRKKRSSTSEKSVGGGGGNGGKGTTVTRLPILPE